MLILAIDASTIAASAAILDEEKLHGEIYTDYKLKHSEKLLPLVDTLLNDLRMTMQQMDVFALSEGPGSFTGLRIEAATAKAFAHACDKPIIGVSTLEACAYFQGRFSGFICPILDAQQNSVYGALFENTNRALRRETADAAIPLMDLIDQIPSDSNVLFCGDAVKKFHAQIVERISTHAFFANHSTMMPRASAVAEIALYKMQNGVSSDYKTFLPNYIRVSQAEANYEIKLD